MSPNSAFDMGNFQTYIMGQHDEPTPIVSATETITSDEIRNLVDGLDATGHVYEVMLDRDGLRVRPNDENIDVDSIYPYIGIDNLHHYHNDSVDAVRYINNDINTTRDYARDVERDKIIEVLKREKNVNTKKCMYVDDLVKEIAKIMEVHL
jgi:hypothetical protein